MSWLSSHHREERWLGCPIAEWRDILAVLSSQRGEMAWLSHCRVERAVLSSQRGEMSWLFSHHREEMAWLSYCRVERYFGCPLITEGRDILAVLSSQSGEISWLSSHHRGKRYLGCPLITEWRNILAVLSSQSGEISWLSSHHREEFSEWSKTGPMISCRGSYVHNFEFVEEGSCRWRKLSSENTLTTPFSIAG